MTIQTNQVFERRAEVDDRDVVAKNAGVARFWDRVAEGYAVKPVPDAAVYAQKLAITREYLCSESDVLEIGCGTGSTALAHAPHVRHICATDVSPKMIEIARGKGDAAGIDNVEFVRAAVDEAYAPGTQYDAILALSLLHLLRDWQDTIFRAHRALRPGGVFVTSTLCLRDSHAWLSWLALFGSPAGLLPTLSFFTGDDLLSGLTDAGFTIERAWQPHRKTGLFVVARRSA